MKYEVEVLYEIWNERGEVVEVGPDRNGFGLIEIRSKDDKGKIDARIVFDKPLARLVAAQLLRACGNYEQAEDACKWAANALGVKQ